MAENVLGTLFGEIANSIRSKTGGTDTMKPAEFPEQIDSITASNVIDNVEIALDFSNGDLTERLPEGYSANSVTIFKPENLIPENIAKDVNIAGIIGTHEGGGGDSGDTEKSIVYASGKTTWNNAVQSVTHGLGVVPDLIVLTGETEGATGKVAIAITAVSAAFKEKSGAPYGCNVFQSDGSNMQNPTTLDQTNSFASYYTVIHQANTSTFTLSKGSMVTFVNGASLIWEAYGNLV